MSGIQWILIALSLIGFLPLVVVVYKARWAKKVITTGASIQATVYYKRRIYKNRVETVYYSFQTNLRAQPYTGLLTTKIGQYRIGDTLTVYYLPQYPDQNTVKGTWKATGMIIFCAAIAAFVLFAAYKLNEMVNQ